MPKLESLYMLSCNLTNLELTVAQYNFLQNLDTSNATSELTVSCPDDSMAILNRNGDQVCVQGATSSIASTSSSNGSHTLAIALGVCGGILVIYEIAVVIYRSQNAD